MKTFMKLTLVAALLALSFSASAQQKMGYVNSQELIASMPEADSMKVKMEAYAKELSDMLESINVEFNNKLAEFQKGTSGMTDAVRQLKEKELNDIRTRFQEFQASADEDMQKQQGVLLQPIIEKAQNAIKKVSKAQNLSAVFDLASGALAYYDEATMINLLPLVKTELGIKEKPKTAAPAAKPVK